MWAYFHGVVQPCTDTSVLERIRLRWRDSCYRLEFRAKPCMVWIWVQLGRRCLWWAGQFDCAVHKLLFQLTRFPVPVVFFEDVCSQVQREGTYAGLNTSILSKGASLFLLLRSFRLVRFLMETWRSCRVAESFRLTMKVLSSNLILSLYKRISKGVLKVCMLPFTWDIWV